MSNDRETLLKEAEHMQRMVVSSLIQEATLPHWLGLNISMAQLKGAFTLAYLKQSTISEFAEMLHIGRSAASLLVDRMVQDGLVERAEDTADRRRMVIRLSGTGMDLVTRLRQERTEHSQLPAWLGKLSTSDLQALVQGLRALTAEAQASTRVPQEFWQACQEEAREE